MRNMTIALVLVLLIGSVSFATLEGLISDGDFSSGSITDVGNKWVLSNSNLNEWYGYSSRGKDFYEVTPQGYAAAALKDNSGRLLLQTIAAPKAGDYTFKFDYRLTDASDMYSVVRIFAVDNDKANFSMKTNKCSGSFSRATSATRIYDQGGSSSYLPTAADWTSVSSSVNVGAAADYLVIYAAFSHDGSKSSLKNEFANLDNFSLTNVSVGAPAVPEPATIAILGLGGFSLIKAKRN